VNSEHRRGSFEDRLSRLKEEPTDDSPVDGRPTSNTQRRAVVTRKASSFQPPQLSDKAANLIATVLKDFLRD